MPDVDTVGNNRAVDITYPFFGELYVISDLHLGDTRGAPIFDQTERLSGLVGRLSTRVSEYETATVGLVLNGDVIDSLPESFEGYVASPADAEAIVKRIRRHPKFAPVFDRLATFVQTPGRALIFVLAVLSA